MGRWDRDVCGPALKSGPSRPPEPLPVILQSEDRMRKKRKNTERESERAEQLDDVNNDTRIFVLPPSH